MAEYERVDDSGQVTERVTTVDGTHEDTRLGVAAIDGTGGWQVVGTEPHPPPAEPPADPPAPARAPAKTTTKGAGRGSRIRPSDS